MKPIINILQTTFLYFFAYIKNNKWNNSKLSTTIDAKGWHKALNTLTN